MGYNDSRHDSRNFGNDSQRLGFETDDSQLDSGLETDDSRLDLGQKAMTRKSNDSRLDSRLGTCDSGLDSHDSSTALQQAADGYKINSSQIAQTELVNRQAEKEQHISQHSSLRTTNL